MHLGPYVKTLTILLSLQIITEFFDIFSTSFQISKFMNIRPVGADFFQADRKKNVRIYRTDEGNAVFS